MQPTGLTGANGQPVAVPQFGTTQPLNMQQATATGGFGGLNAFTQAAQQLGATGAQATQQQTSTNYAPTVQQQTSSPSGQLISRAFDDQIGNYQNMLNNQLPTYQNLSSNIVRNDVAGQQGAIDQQYQTGQANHQLGQQALDTSHTNSVRDLGDQLRTALAGYQNQLGVQGAGNSSAAGLLSYALQNQGQRGMNDLNDQYNQQQSGLNVAGNDLDQKYTLSKQQLETFKTDNLQQIAISYSQQADQIKQALSQATGQKAIYLQNAGADLANQALAQMKQLEQQYSDGHSSVDQAYQIAKSNAPTQDISQYANNFNVNPLTTQQIQATSLQNNQPQNNQTNYNSPVSLQRRDITQPA